MVEFFKRVGRQEGVDLAEAILRARAVISVVCEAVPPDKLASIRIQLPGEFNFLFIGEKD